MCWLEYEIWFNMPSCSNGHLIYRSTCLPTAMTTTIAQCSAPYISHTNLAWVLALFCATTVHKLFQNSWDDWLRYPEWLPLLEDHQPAPVWWIWENRTGDKCIAPDVSPLIASLNNMLMKWITNWRQVVKITTLIIEALQPSSINIRATEIIHLHHKLLNGREDGISQSFWCSWRGLECPNHIWVLLPYGPNSLLALSIERWYCITACKTMENWEPT